ncbi:nitrite reductase [Apiospora arundinis]
MGSTAVPEDKLTSLVLLPAAAELLQGRYTPNLQDIQIHFDFEFDVDAGGDDDGGGFSSSFEEPEMRRTRGTREEYWDGGPHERNLAGAVVQSPREGSYHQGVCSQGDVGLPHRRLPSFPAVSNSANLEHSGTITAPAGKPTWLNATSFSSPKTWTRSSSVTCTTSGIWRSTRPRKGRSDARVSATSRWRWKPDDLPACIL